MARIAEGGMGIIYRAEHLRLPRRVAIKVLKPDLARFAALVERFIEEARAVNQIHHPNLVDIIDVAELPGNPPVVYLVMELLEGADLASHLRSEGALDPLEAVEIADAVADGLLAAHRQKILHRDLKAENIFLCSRPDGSYSVKLLDFGIATTFGTRGSRKLTSPGSRVGTPDCMAPEQVSGDPLDERTDIYALGLVVYHMLAGAPAFHSTNIDEVLAEQLYATPPPIRRRGEAIPPALEQVVMKCLCKRPDDRYPDVSSFRDALWSSIGVDDGRRYLPRHVHGGSTLGNAPTLDPGRLPAPKRTRRGPSRGRWLVMGVVAGFALPLLGLIAGGPQRTPSASAPPASAPPATCSPFAEKTAVPASAVAGRLVPAPLLENSKLEAAVSEEPVAQPVNARRDPTQAVPAWRRRGPGVEERPPPAKLDPPAVKDSLDRTVDPFSIEARPKPTAPVAVRDRI